MSDTIIRVENLSKRYRIGLREQAPETLRDAAKSLLSAPFGYLRRMSRPPTEEETLWALRDVSFEVKQGEVLGIIGRNGAGKSTLLKILSRITEPSSGSAQVFGRVGSLLEVGTGFHPELTGRENIYLNGAILGMKRSEIDRKFDEIVAFSEVEKFLDTPVKRYSSGMYVRLAFAVAAHLEPEILIIDEVLAVGDAAFQGKCLAHMSKLSQGGSTILFVSHNLLAVRDICTRVILVAKGSVHLDGDTDTIIASYRDSSNSTLLSAASPSDYLSLMSLRLNGAEVGESVSHVPNSPVLLELVVHVYKPIYDAILNLVIELPNGRYALHLRSDIAGVRFSLSKGHHLLSIETGDLSLSPGMYVLWIRLVSTHHESGVLWDTKRITLDVEGFTPLDSIVWPIHSFRHERLNVEVIV